MINLFIHKNNDLLDKNIKGLSSGAEAMLAGYDYPGNVRELENIIEHAVVMAEGNEITEKDLPEFILMNRLRLEGPVNNSSFEPESRTLHTEENIVTLKQLESDHIRRAMAKYKNNHTEIAQKLGVSRSTLWRKIKEYKLV
ncbi:MAG TPA: hypothetical protein DCO75_11295 [Fibrobacteres bacterium]|nr:hypothetical protein [Fibrobacterota bacterium]